MASEKFWTLEKRIREDKRNPGVEVEFKRSNMREMIANTLYDGVITEADLEGFCDDTIASVIWFQKFWNQDYATDGV